MTSIYSADNPYYPEGPSVPIVTPYRRGGVMEYIYHHSPVMAWCLQKTGNDKWVDLPTFQGTIFVPSEAYCRKYLDHFQQIDYLMAHDLTLMSILPHPITAHQLRAQEFVPTWKKGYLKVDSDDVGVYVDGLRIRRSVVCDNGIVHILDGCVSLKDMFLD